MDDTKQTQVVGVGNQKGGVSKTTVTCHLAAALGELGRKVLIWDLDANAGSTKHFGVPDTFLGSYEVMLGDEDPQDVIITPDEDPEITLPPNVHLLAARRNLDNLESDIRARNRFADARDSLRTPIAKLVGRYDYIFLDTAPNVSSGTMAAYKAARWFLLVGVPEPFAIQGLAEAMEDMKAARETSGSQIELLGVVLSCVDRRTRLSSQLVDFVRTSFPSHAGAFSTNISRAIAIPNAQDVRKTVFQTDPTHKVAEEYRTVAREVEERIRTRLNPQPQQQEPAVAVAVAPAVQEVTNG